MQMTGLIIMEKNIALSTSWQLCITSQTWSSDAFLRYIRKQVLEFSHNVSKRMLRFRTHRHVPDFDPGIAANDPRVRNDPNNAETRRNVGGDATRRNRLPAFSQFN
jgi:hypothetical protein